MSIQIWKDFDTWGDGAQIAAVGSAQIAADDRRRRGDPLPQGDLAFVASHFKCPACLCGRLRRRPLFDRLDGGLRRSEARVCSFCRRGYMIRIEKAALGAEQPAGGYHWDMPSEGGEG